MADAERQSQSSFPIDTTLAALGLAVITVASALVIGFFAGVGMALLAVVTGALLGAILLVWHSLRTLAGDAEVDPALELATNQAPTVLSEKKRRALRALKDLEQEHDLGKIDDADYALLDAEYRSQAKDVIREMDGSLAPFREKAEALVKEHLAKHPIEEEKEEEPAEAPDEAPEDAIQCPKCSTKNDPDAAFCKKCGEKLEPT
jgi:ribosomal protein L40E